MAYVLAVYVHILYISYGGVEVFPKEIDTVGNRCGKMGFAYFSAKTLFWASSGGWTHTCPPLVLTGMMAQVGVQCKHGSVSRRKIFQK